ncbi:MAG: MBL fold metallo-hydrolase [Candidatus Sericytochromatia bacterium]|nr:MBL fold metallo-hydrolase [Candidatus Sericytochromatia bacterium]
MAEEVALPHWIRQEADSGRETMPEAPPEPPPADCLRLTWLGTACFLVQSPTTTLLLDPFVSRPNLWRTISAPLTPDPMVLERVARWLPRPTALLVGHAHYDHALDAAPIAMRHRAPLLASPGMLRLARAQGLPAQLAEPVAAGESRVIGDLEVTFVPSAHAPIATQWLVGGDVAEEPRPPLRLADWRHDAVLGLRIRWRGRILHHSGSAEVLGMPGQWAPTDVLMLCMAGWTATPGLLERVHGVLAPRVLLPMHHDDFFRPLGEGFRPLTAARKALADRTWPRTLAVTAVAPVNRHFQQWTLSA